MHGGKRSGAGRKKGVPNKFTAQLKDMILNAAELAGDDIEPNGGTVAYLKQQAKLNPGPFMSLLGKVMPTQIAGDPENPLHLKHESDAAFKNLCEGLDGLVRSAASSNIGKG